MTYEDRPSEDRSLMKRFRSMMAAAVFVTFAAPVVKSVTAPSVVPALGLFLSAMSIFSLVSVSVSWRRREIGVRAALGARPLHLLSRIVSRPS